MMDRKSATGDGTPDNDAIGDGTPECMFEPLILKTAFTATPSLAVSAWLYQPVCHASKASPLQLMFPFRLLSFSDPSPPYLASFLTDKVPAFLFGSLPTLPCRLSSRQGPSFLLDRVLKPQAQRTYLQANPLEPREVGPKQRESWVLPQTQHHVAHISSRVRPRGAQHADGRIAGGLLTRQPLGPSSSSCNEIMAAETLNTRSGSHGKPWTNVRAGN